MEIQRTKRIRAKYNDFAGGIQTYTSPFWLADNETPFCKNVDLSRPGEIRKAFGYSQLGTGTGGDSPRGSFIFDQEDGTSTPYKLTDNVLSKWNGTSWVSVTGGLGIATGTSHIESCLMYINTGTGVGTGADSFVERIYFSIGLDDTVKYTDGVNIGNIASTYAKHIEAYKSRIYIGNIKQGSKTYPSRVIFSDINSDSFTSTNYIDDFGEPITALKEYSGSLFFFSENKLAAYDETNLQTMPGNYGTTNSETIQKTYGKLIWYNRKGVYMYAGSELPQDISKKIKEWLDVITSPSEVTAFLDEEERYNLCIGDVVLDGVTYQDVVLRYDVSLNIWDILPDRPFKYGIRQRSGGTYVVYATDVDQDRVWKVNDTYSLNGDDIISEWQSSKFDLGRPDTLKDFYKADITFEPQGVNEYLTLQYRLNGATGWNNMENTTNNISVSGVDDIETKRLIFPPSTQGNIIQFRITHTSDTNGFKIYEITINNDELKTKTS